VWWKLLYTPLFDIVRKVALIENFPEFWKPYYTNPAFHRSIGWILKHASEKVSLEDSQLRDHKGFFSHLIADLIVTPQEDNFLLNQSLKVFPDLARPKVLAWIIENSHLSQTHYLLKIWLDRGEKKDAIKNGLMEWLKVHSFNRKASFVFQSWLDAGGERSLVEGAIKEWLGVEENRLSLKASFVFKSWLDAGGPFSLVHRSTEDWLHENKDHPEAEYVIARIAEEDDLSLRTVCDVLYWCHQHSDHPEVIWRLARLRKNLECEEIAELILTCAEELISTGRAYNDNDSVSVEAILSNINSNPACLMSTTGGASGPLSHRFDALCAKWFRMEQSFSHHSLKLKVLQRPYYFLRYANLILRGLISPVYDRKPISKWLTWINGWTIENKREIRGKIILLKERFPAHTDLWSILDSD